MPVTSLQLRRERLTAALARAVELNPFADISDPVTWQREQREYRLLPGRNNAVWSVREGTKRAF